MKKVNVSPALLWVSLILIVTSCTPTRIVSSWSIPNPPTDALKKVLVLGVMADREIRDQLEQTMVNALNNEKGIHATSAVYVFGPNRFKQKKEEDIVDTLKRSNFTSVMIVSLVKREKEVDYVPPTYYYPYAWGYSQFYRRYWYLNDQVYIPNYYTTSTNWVLQVDIYTIEGDELIYSTQTKSFDPNNAKDLAESFTKSIINELRTKRMIP